MYYFRRGQFPDVSIACAECQDRAEALVAQGYTRISYDHYMATWKYRDHLRLWALRQAVRAEQPRARVIGELW